ncbi:MULTISPECIES: hypothetical protein [Streptomyces]|uniref:hypothetical protein n=1 Tax=Streptomyces TaxID=1883 RepID=UPI00117C26E8|nr:hypothetical protein [Streptomyces kasugaensis]
MALTSTFGAFSDHRSTPYAPAVPAQVRATGQLGGPRRQARPQDRAVLREDRHRLIAELPHPDHSAPPWTTGEIQPAAQFIALRRPAEISRMPAVPGPRTY